MRLFAALLALLGIIGSSFLFLVAIIAIPAIVNGFMLKVLWSWFAVPVFNLPALTIPQAMGLCLVIGLLTRQYTIKDERKPPAEPDERSLGEKLAIGAKALGHAFLNMALGLVITLLFGWALHRYF